MKSNLKKHFSAAPSLRDMPIHRDPDFMKELMADVSGFERLAEFLRSSTGISLIPNEKNYALMSSRLVSVLRAREIKGYGAYLRILREGDSELVTEFINSLTTNTTQFFREAAHFSIFGAELKKVAQNRHRTTNGQIRIWCAAASTGQEPYTIMMTASEILKDFPMLDLRMLATDIDHDVLQKASLGIYTESELQGVPSALRKTYFQSLGASDDSTSFRVLPSLRKRIRFAPFNLLTPSFPFELGFDFVFCRNVLIYFDRDTSRQVISKIGQVLKPEGMLFLGHSETGVMKHTEFQSIATAAYKKIGESPR